MRKTQPSLARRKLADKRYPPTQLQLEQRHWDDVLRREGLGMEVEGQDHNVTFVRSYEHPSLEGIDDPHIRGVTYRAWRQSGKGSYPIFWEYSREASLPVMICNRCKRTTIRRRSGRCLAPQCNPDFLWGM